LPELGVQLANLLLQLGHPRLKLGHRRSQLKDNFIPLVTPRTLRLRRHSYPIG
jgi:hypothetical protein